MEYRQLPHGTEQERFSVLGLCMGSIQNAPGSEIKQVVRTAADHGINFFLEQGGEYGIGSTAERAKLLRRCEAEGVGVSVMKPFHGGKLLDARQWR